MIITFRCYKDCTIVEKGYVCPTQGKSCKSVCGDGYYISGEECEDGNLSSQDGCSLLCKVENYWTCTHSGTKAKDHCTTKCGDGRILGKEACDDGNYVSGDG